MDSIPEQKFCHVIIIVDCVLTIFCKWHGNDVNTIYFFPNMTEIQSWALALLRFNFYFSVMHVAGIDEGGTKGVL